jgi:hypothetical protein
MTPPRPTPVPCPKCQPPADCKACGNTRLCYFVPAETVYGYLDWPLTCNGYVEPGKKYEQQMTQAGVWIWGPIFEEGEK